VGCRFQVLGSYTAKLRWPVDDWYHRRAALMIESAWSRVLVYLLPARRYACAGTCPVSVCVCHKSVFYRNGWTNRTGFGMGSSFHLSNTVVRKFRYLKIKVLLSETLLQTLDLEKNFATAYRSLKRVINLARERWKSVLQLDLDQHWVAAGCNVYCRSVPV